MMNTVDNIVRCFVFCSVWYAYMLVCRDRYTVDDAVTKAKKDILDCIEKAKPDYIEDAKGQKYDVQNV